MQLLLVRHADAGNRDPAVYADDTQRPLTDKGRKVQARMGRRLRRRGLVPTTILSSPWARAWQSALILGEQSRSGELPVECPALAAAPDLAALHQALGSRGHDEVVALVGHEPWMGELASLLLTGDPDRLAIDFPKSGVVGIEISEIGSGAGTLRFLLRPKGH